MANTSAPRRPSRAAIAAARFANAERRTRLHMRELCDEVLASWRVARGADPISDADRALASSLLPQLGR